MLRKYKTWGNWRYEMTLNIKISNCKYITNINIIENLIQTDCQIIETSYSIPWNIRLQTIGFDSAENEPKAA